MAGNRSIWLITAAVVGALLLGACGGGGSSSGGGDSGGSAGGGGSASANPTEVKEAVLQEEVSSSEAFFAGDGKAFCAELTPTGRRKTLAEIGRSLGVKAPCAQVMSGLAKEFGAAIKTLKREVAELTPADVSVHGTHATVTFPASAPVTLEESGGRWYITRAP